MKIICTLIFILFCLTTEAGWRWLSLTPNSGWMEIRENGRPGPILTNSLTMSVWIKRQLDRGTTRSVLIGKGRTQPNPVPAGICYELHILTNHFRFVYSDVEGSTIHVWQATSPAPVSNELAHIALKITFKDPTNINLFINGTNYSGTWVEGTGTGTPTNQNQSMMFGQDAFGTPFMGLFNEIAIWNSMLSDQEILSLYNTRLKRFPLTVSRSTLVGYWPLDGWPENRQETTDTIPFILNMKYGGTNLFYGSVEGFGAIGAVNESMFSYPPNE